MWKSVTRAVSIIHMHMLWFKLTLDYDLAVSFVLYSIYPIISYTRTKGKKLIILRETLYYN